jgi:hypothetical protein
MEEEASHRGKYRVCVNAYLLKLFTYVTYGSSYVTIGEHRCNISNIVIHLVCMCVCVCVCVIVSNKKKDFKQYMYQI